MVVKSPFAPVKPAVFLLSPYGTSWINIRINPEVRVGDALPEIEAVFKKIIPSVPFEYKFAAEERIGKLDISRTTKSGN